MTINLLDAATYFRGLDGQVKAFRWLNSILTEEQKEEFAKQYREDQLSQAKPDINTWNGVLLKAKEAGAKFPEVVAAQWALESSWGKAFSGKWNAFGLKGNGTSAGTKEFINGKWVEITAGFLDFPDLETAIQYLIDRWYKDFETYKGVNRAKNRNECAELLVTEKYATDPGYATKLIQIMDRQIGTTTGVTNKKDPVAAARPFTPKSPFEYKITPNIAYGELCLNQEGRRFTSQHQCETAIELCRFLEKARTAFGNKPLIITSGHRPPSINKSVGGASGSEHLYSAANEGAVDFYVKGADIYEVQKYCDKNWPYSVGYGAQKGFVHLGIRRTKQRIRWDY